jgi:sec-independent protein translocase protein TatA
MFGLGMSEVLVVLLIGLVLFGNKPPDLARSLGKALAEFKHETNGLADDFRGPLK